MNLLDLCSGVGMLGLAVEMLLAEVGHAVRLVAYCEMAPYPRRVLEARFADGSLQPAPVLHDVTRLPLPDLLGRVDLICAGFPCQPVSVAGRRLAQDDERWLWPYVAGAAGHLRPRLLFLENVPGILTAGGVDVASDLARLGYDAEWGCLGSADVGASHQRERWFCLAWSGWRNVADTDRAGREGRRVLLRQRADEWATREGGAPLCLHAWGSGDPRWKDPPTSEDPPQPAICRVADGLASWVDRDRAVGNGVDPLAAAVAFALLGKRGGLWEI